MKKRLFIGIVLLLLLAIGGFFAIRYNTPKEENSMNAITDTHQKQNSPEAILATLSPEDQEFIKKDYEEKMQRIKASGNAEWVAKFEKTYWENVQESTNSDDISDLDDHQSVVYYEKEIRKAKKESASEERITLLEGLRDFYKNSIAIDKELERQYEEIDREFQADQARYEALSTPEEKMAYHQEKLQEAEEELLEAQEELRLAKEKGDPTDIRMKELLVKGAESSIDTQKRRLAWIPKEQALDARIKEWEEVKRPQLIEKYRSFLQIVEIDGVERIVGVRTPAEIKVAAKELLSDSSPPESSSVPSLPDTQSPSTPKLQQTAPERSVDPPSPQGEAAPQQPPAAAMESIVNAQTQFQSWREDVDDDYLDVLVSQYMTPQEIEQFFPTEADRQNLTKRTERLQQDVVSKVRKLVNGIPNATQAQKSKLARELVTANFDKDFADAVIEQLQLDEK